MAKVQEPVKTLAAPLTVYSAPKTYARYMAHPMFRPINISRLDLKAVAKMIDTNWTKGAIPDLKNPVQPEREAITFYTLNHLFAMVPMMKGFHAEKRLPDTAIMLAEKYIEEVCPVTIRAFYYLCMIVNREMRHAKKAAHDIEPKFGKEEGYASLHAYYGGLKGTYASSPEKHFLNGTYSMPFGLWTEFFVWGFTAMGFSGGYGGKPWSEVAKCLNRFVQGETSAEIMTDTVWTLAHNNGPIFNKGMLYHHYDSQNLTRILDVQRAGMMPNLMSMEYDQTHQYMPSGLKDTIKEAEDLFGEEFGPVDWQKVVSLGAVGNYSKELGTSPTPKPKAPVKPKAPPVPKLPNEKQFYVMPSLSVKKHDLIRAKT